MREVREDTVEALKRRKEELSWRKLAEVLGFGDRPGFHATLCTIAKQGMASVDLENEVRAALGLTELTEWGNIPNKEKRYRWSATEKHEQARLESGMTSTEFIEHLLENQ